MGFPFTREDDALAQERHTLPPSPPKRSLRSWLIVWTVWFSGIGLGVAICLELGLHDWIYAGLLWLGLALSIWGVITLLVMGDYVDE